MDKSNSNLSRKSSLKKTPSVDKKKVSYTFGTSVNDHILEKMGGQRELESLASTFISNCLGNLKIRKFFQDHSLVNIHSVVLGYFMHVVGAKPLNLDNVRKSPKIQSITEEEYCEIFKVLSESMESMKIKPEIINQIMGFAKLTLLEIQQESADKGVYWK